MGLCYAAISGSNLKRVLVVGRYYNAIAVCVMLLCGHGAASAQETNEEGREVYGRFGSGATIYKGNFYCEMYLDFTDGTSLRLNAHADRTDFFFNVANRGWTYLEPNVGRSAQVNFSFERGSTQYGYVGLGRVYKHEGQLGFGGSGLTRDLLRDLVYEPNLWLKFSVDGIALPPHPVSPKGVADAVTKYEQCIRDSSAEYAQAVDDVNQILGDL